MSFRRRFMLDAVVGASLTRGASVAAILREELSSIFARTSRLTASLMNSVLAGSNGIGRSTRGPLMGSERRSLAVRSRSFRDGVTTVRRIPERREAVASTNARPRTLAASKRTTSPGRRDLREISASTALADSPCWSGSVRSSSGRDLSRRANSRRFLSSNASVVTTSRSA